jgi:hypothetical protein
MYLIGVLYGPSLPRAWCGPALAVVMIGLSVGYARHGLRSAAKVQQHVTRLEALVQEGQEPAQVALQCAASMQSTPEQLQICLEQLRTAGMGPYRNMPASRMTSARHSGDKLQ